MTNATLAERELPLRSGDNGGVNKTFKLEGVQVSQSLEDSLNDRQVVLVSITTSGFGNRRRLDPRELNPDINDAMISASKALLDSDELRKINTACNNMVEQVRRKSVPATSILKKGTYAITPEMVIPIWQMLKDFTDNKLPELVNKLREAYPRLKEEARKKLGEFFEPSQYPAVDVLCKKFGITYKFFTVSLPNINSLKDPLTDAFLEEAQRQATEEIRQFIDEAKVFLRLEITDFVDNLVEMLEPREDGRKRKLYGSTLKKVEQFIVDFAARNIADDKELQEQLQRLGTIISGTTIDSLRNSDFTRSRVRNGLQTVQEKLKPLIVDVPSRAVTLD